MPKSDNIEKSKAIKAWGILVAVLAIIIAIPVILVTTKQKKVEADGYSVSMMTMSLAEAHLHGSDDIPKNVCTGFRDMAKKWNQSTDWFSDSYCDYIIKADYVETENNLEITLYDEGYAAIYTFDHDRKYLVNFEFKKDNTQNKGYYLSIDN